MSAEKNLQILRELYPWPAEKPDIPPALSGWLQSSNQKMLAQLCTTKTRVVVELGSWLGLSAKFFLDVAPNATVLCVDHWQGSREHQHVEEWRSKLPILYETFLVNLWEYRDRVIPIKRKTVEGLKVIHSLGIHPDVVYIDASHEYKDVCWDVHTALELFPDSIICGDDWSWSDVQKAVSEIASNFKKKVHIEDGHAWYLWTAPTFLTDEIGQPDDLTISDSFRKGTELFQQGRNRQAELVFYDIVKKAPSHAGARHLLGMIFHSRKQFHLAVEHLEHALRLCPTEAVYHNDYGVVLGHLQRLDDAKVAFQRAIALAPHHTEARVNLGFTHLLQNDWAQAEFELNTAILLQPDHGDAQKRLAELRFHQGNHLVEHERLPEAKKMFFESAVLPGGKEVWRWRHLGLCPTVFHDTAAIDRYWRELNEDLDIALSENIAIDWRTLPGDGFIPSFNLPHLDKCCRDVKEKFAAFFNRAFPFDRPTFEQVRRNRVHLRIGFVVTPGHHRGFLHVHRELVERIDPKKFEVFFLCPAPILEECRKAFRRPGITFVGFPERFDLAVETIRDTRCDILYHWKVGGGSLDYFLPFARLAPVQCTSYGTHGTSGTATVDYYLTSPYLESPDADFTGHYTEELFLFERHIGFLKPEYPLTETFHHEFGLSETETIYFCPHRLAKYQPRFDPLLRAILERDPAGRLVLLTHPDSVGDNMLRKRLRSSLGDTLLKRTTFFPFQTHDALQRLFATSDVVLDSPVYAGSLTSYNAFSQGVPVVTFSGDLAVQCYTAGLYRRMGIEAFAVPQNTSEYINQAVALGTDAAYRHFVRCQIEEKRQLIFNDDQCVKDFERFVESVSESSSFVGP